MPLTPDAMMGLFVDREAEMLALLERLVNIDSGTGHGQGIEQIVDILEPMLQDIGLTTERRPSPVGPHLVAYGAKSPQVLLMGHIDTVFPVGTAAARPFRREGDRAYGPGVIDMKSGIVNLLYVVKALADAGGLHQHVRIVINADEEISSIHSRDVIYEQSRLCRAAFVFEPSQAMETLTTSRKGVGDLTLSITGKAAHAGAAIEDGLSAVEELARKILDLHALTDVEKGRSVNVGIVSGGTARNVVAEHASARIDLRYATKADGEAILDEIRAVCVPSGPGYTVELMGGITRPPLERSEGIAALFEHMREAGRAFGIDFVEASSGGVSDANLIADAGIPVIDSLGPVGGRAHSDAEYLEVNTMAPRAAVAAWAVYRWLRQTMDVANDVGA